MVTKNRAVKWDGVAKIDLWADEGAADACVARIQLPEGHHNGETVFVPRCARCVCWGYWGVGRVYEGRGVPTGLAESRRAGCLLV